MESGWEEEEHSQRLTHLRLLIHQVSVSKFYLKTLLCLLHFLGAPVFLVYVLQLM